MITTNYNLKHFLCEAGGNILDVCATVYIDYLKKLKESEPSKIEEGSNLLRIFLEWRGETDNLESDPTVFPTEECDKIIGKIYKVIDSIVTNLAAKNPDENSFYLALTEKLFDDLLFCNDLEKSVALLCLFANTKTPYYQLGERLSMDDDEYCRISDRYVSEIRKSFFILDYGFEQNTEVASLIFQVLDGIDNPKDKSVVLANIIGYLNKRAINNIDGKTN